MINDFYIRQSSFDDIDVIMDIYKKARVFMAQNGNSTQWGNGQPSKERLLGSIKNKTHYVCCTKNNDIEQIVLAFALVPDTKEQLSSIYEGRWISDSHYYILKSFASSFSVKGAAIYTLNWISRNFYHIRLETHQNNTAMINLVTKCGFKYCGIHWGTSKIHNNFTKRLLYCKIKEQV